MHSPSGGVNYDVSLDLTRNVAFVNDTCRVLSYQKDTRISFSLMSGDCEYCYWVQLKVSILDTEY